MAEYILWLTNFVVNTITTEPDYSESMTVLSSDRWDSQALMVEIARRLQHNNILCTCCVQPGDDCYWVFHISVCYVVSFIVMNIGLPRAYKYPRG